MEKRRWILLLLFKETEPDVTELHLVPFESFKFKQVTSSAEHPAAKVKSLIESFVRDRSPSAINSAYAAIARVQRQLDATAKPPRESFSPRTPVTRGANRAARGTTNADEAGVTSTIAGADAGIDTSLKIAMDLNGWGPTRLMK
eukprot:1795520-Pleurochrysis_carterae.AAC.1